MRGAAFLARSAAHHHDRCVRGDVIAKMRRALRALLDPYRPERHYMRGPGPKCREKRENGS